MVTLTEATKFPVPVTVVGLAGADQCRPLVELAVLVSPPVKAQDVSAG